MSQYRNLFNLGQFGLEVSSNNPNLIEDFKNYLHPTEENLTSYNLSLKIEDNPDLLKEMTELFSSNKYTIVPGYMKTPFKHLETENAIFNYDEKRHIVIAKSKVDQSVQVVLDTKTSSKFKSIPMYIAREMIIRENENLGNIILHSASVFHDNKAYAIVGGPGAGKTSLLLGLLKGNDGKVAYVSNDINFISPNLSQIFPFQIPMLLSDATADSFFGEKKDESLDGISTISYFHEKDKEMITKFKIDRKAVEELFKVNSLFEASFGGIIIPRFNKNKKGFSVEVLNKQYAKELINSQVLSCDDRFAYDYLGLSRGKYSKVENILDPVIDSTPIVCVTYGKDIFEEENIQSLKNIFKFLHRSETKQFELHCHTTASDGNLTPEQIVNKARSQGVQLLSITDHNTVDGLRKAQQYIQENNITGLDLLPGVELDACDLSCLHILGYGIQDIDLMDSYLKELDKKNEGVYLQIIDNLASLGVDISPQKVMDTFGIKKLSKQHIGNYLQLNGYAKNSNEVTQKYLGKDCPSYVPRIQPTAQECIEIIHRCGGKSILAHPMELMKYNQNMASEQDILKFIRSLQTVGLDGVECCTDKHTPSQEGLLLNFCDKVGMLKTIGNDYHGKDSQNFGTDELDIIEEFKLAISQTESSM